MTILITGAAGRTSGYVIKALLDSQSIAATDLRLLVRSPAAVERVQAKFPQLPASAFVRGDYLEASTLPPALQNVATVFHNGPAFHAQETAMGVALIDAAKQAGVRHFVYCSVLFPILDKLLNHKVKCAVEEYLVESGLNYTILEPSSFMQNIDLEAVRASSRLRVAYSPTVLQGYLDLQDLASVACLVLLEPTLHSRARYELVGQNYTFEDVAREVSAVLGKPIVCEQIPREQAVARGINPLRVGGDYAGDAMDRMLYYYNKRGIPGNSNVLRWILGRDPTTWANLLRREYGAER